MKRFFQIIAIALLLASCNEISIQLKVKSSFDNPFPKRTKNLVWVLGEEFILKQANDTNYYSVSFDKDTRENIIINKNNNDTVFEGTVCKYRGLYYFNRKLNDTTFWIYAVRINNGTIQGLQTEWYQMKLWDEKFESFYSDPNQMTVNYSPVLKYVDTVNNIIGLTPIKKEMKLFYESIVDSLDIDSIIDWQNNLEENNVEQELNISEIEEVENDDYEIISNLYPNPANDYTNLTLKNDLPYNYGIFDINGKQIQNGKLLSKTNSINVSNFTNGVYYIRVYSSSENEVETIKLIIEKD